MAANDTGLPAILVIMAKAPLPGRCKTRLRGRVGLRGAARVQHQLLRQRVELAVAAGAPTELHGAPDLRHPALLAARRRGLILRRQQAGDLGRRMLRAQGRRPVVIIGTDCPALGPDTLRRALDAVRAGRNVCVPASDGGYVLIGLCRPHAPGFHAIDWGSAAVLRQSRRQCRRGGLQLEEWPALPDLDTGPDLRRERRCGHLAAYGIRPF